MADDAEPDIVLLAMPRDLMEHFTTLFTLRAIHFGKGGDEGLWDETPVYGCVPEDAEDPSS